MNSKLHEIFVSLADLANTIRETSMEQQNSGIEEESLGRPDTEGLAVPLQSSGTRGESGPMASRATPDKALEYIYIDSDQYFGYDRALTKTDASNWKVVLKGLSTVRQRCETYVSQLTGPGVKSILVFSVPLSFWTLREFGTCLMRRENERSAYGASVEMTEKYPKHKRDLKTLAVAIDNFMKRSGVWSSAATNRREVSNSLLMVFILLYSRQDDRFDVVSYSSDSNDAGSVDVGQTKYGRKGDKNK